MNFMKRVAQRWEEHNTLVCVGLDSQYDRIPEHIRGGMDVAKSILTFNISIVQATADLVCCYKPNFAFYLEMGLEGLRALKGTIKYIHTRYGIPVLLDGKWQDIGNTSLAYARGVFDELEADAITMHPYLGAEASAPFLDRMNKGIFVLCRTSNSGAGEFQDHPHNNESIPLYELVAKNVATTRWNYNDNCGLVVGATYPEELARVRGIAPNLPLLIPGLGAQKGDAEATVKAGVDANGVGAIINSSRSIIFASSGEDFAEAARAKTRELRNNINLYRLFR